MRKNWDIELGSNGGQANIENPQRYIDNLLDEQMTEEMAKKNE